jgi:hypothetical protein
MGLPSNYIKRLEMQVKLMADRDRRCCPTLWEREHEYGAV